VKVSNKGVVEKEDFIVCFPEASKLLDKLSQDGNIKTISLNTLKHV
jgi:hypothetical protein